MCMHIRMPPSRRLLYHEFDIPRSPWDYFLEEALTLTVTLTPSLSLTPALTLSLTLTLTLTPTPTTTPTATATATATATQESEHEEHARLVRAHAELTGDCTFYHNCTDPLPPPLLLLSFECWLPNATEQPNVSAVTPRSLTKRPRLHPPNENTTFEAQIVHCIRPSWPNSTSISCLTPYR